MNPMNSLPTSDPLMTCLPRILMPNSKPATTNQTTN